MTAINQAVAITWQTMLFDSDNIVDLAQPTRLTAQTPGYYDAQVTVGWTEPDGTTGLGFSRIITIWKNGDTSVSGRKGPFTIAAVGSAVELCGTASATFYLNVGDYLEARFYHSASASVDYSTILTNAEFQMKWTAK